jgi:Zn-dependent protease with chaperone function
VKLLLILFEGQLYLASVIAVFLAEIGLLAWGLWSRRPALGLVAIFAILPLVRTTLGAIRALFFRIRPPEGITVERSVAPRLHDMVEEICSAVGAPRVDVIIVTQEFEASAVIDAWLWPIGRRRTLVLGLPVLATLSSSEIRPVIAHELAHFSNAHDVFAACVYRTRRSWFDLYATLNRRQATPLYVCWLIQWYVPRLNATSAPVARQHEIEADRIAASVAGSRAAADALVVFEAAALFADRFHWPGIARSFQERSDMPHPFSEMLTWKARLSDPDGVETLKSLFAHDTSPDDTHPSLRERFAKLGEESRLPPPISHSAGAEILGNHLAVIAGIFDERWRTKFGETWRQRRGDFLTRTERLERLNALENPTPEELFERAQLLESLRSTEEALSIFQRAAALGHAESALAAGRLLMDMDDGEGIPLIERAMNQDEHLVPEGCRLLADYYKRTDQELAARKSEWRATRYATQTKLAR